MSPLPFIQQICYRTIENGLANRHILHDIKPILRVSASDEFLIAEFSPGEPFKKTIEDLTAVVAKLTEQVYTSMNQQPIRRWNNRCEKCIKENQQSCNHCFKCMSTNHQSRNCQGNRFGAQKQGRL